MHGNLKLVRRIHTNKKKIIYKNIMQNKNKSADRRLARLNQHLDGIQKIMTENQGDKSSTWKAMKKWRRFLKSPLSEVKRLDSYDRMIEELKEKKPDDQPSSDV